MKKTTAKLIIALMITAQLQGFFLLFPEQIDSANLTNVSDTLSNSRLSFRGQTSGAVAVNSGLINIQTTAGSMAAANTSTGTGTLVEGDVVKLGTNPAYSIKTIETAARFTISNGTGVAVALNDGDVVISTSSAIHTVTFTPAAAISNGAFRVLIPVGATAGDANDGLPHKDGFDFGGYGNVGTGQSWPTSTVTCSGGSGYTFETGTATSSATTLGTTTFHSFECRYRGNGATTTPITMTIGSPSSAKLINPSPATTTHNMGNADTYVFRVQQTEGTVNSYSVLDTTIGRIGVIDAVRVTATVAPIITFTITGVGIGATACNLPMTVTSTVNSIPLGTISTTAFTDAAQLLSVSTNAFYGYSVVASESGIMTATDFSATIPDTTCGGSCTVITAADWITTSQRGFGYALENVTGTPVPAAIRYNNGGTYKARPFGITAQQIMTNSVAVDVDQARVCYRVIVSGTQQAGDYENDVIYIATAVF